MNDLRSPGEQNPPPSNKWKLFLGIGLAVALIVAAQFFNFQGILKNALESIANLGPWGPAAFILIYIIATVLFIPGSLLTLGSGVLFGVGGGTVCVSIGSVLGATCAFLIGRYLTRDWVSKQIAGNLKFQAIDSAVASEGWKIVLLTRQLCFGSHAGVSQRLFFRILDRHDSRNRDVCLYRFPGW
jgi:uncharacterized membrane protein YdjX (TVP38/TMEM64 family)